MTLFIWKLILSLFMQLRFPILTAICLSVAVGYCNEVGDFLALSRMFFFFPFFLAGFKYRHSVKSIRFPAMGLITGLILLISLFLILYVSPQETKWVLGSRSYALLGLHGWCAGILRLTQYAASFALASVSQFEGND